MKRYLAIDIGGTFIKYGIFNEKGEGKNYGKIPTIQNPEEFLDELVNIIETIKAIENIEGVAISMAGFINVKTGENLDFTVGEIFTKYNLKEILKEKTGYNIAVENDANCALLAEKWIGAGRNVEDFVVVTLGTGIGGAIMVNGKMLRGKNFAAGEFGIMNLGKSSNGELRYAGATSTLVEKVSKKLNKELDGKFIFENLDKNIEIKKIYDKWIDNIAYTLSNIAIVLDPEKMLIGGAISSQERFINDIKGKIYKLYFHLEKSMVIEKCMLENNAGMVGAVYNYLQEFNK